MKILISILILSLTIIAGCATSRDAAESSGSRTSVYSDNDGKVVYSQAIANTRIGVIEVNPVTYLVAENLYLHRGATISGIWGYTGLMHVYINNREENIQIIQRFYTQLEAVSYVRDLRLRMY